MKTSEIYFEVLALDPKGESRAKSVKSLAHAVGGVSELWKDSSVDGNTGRIDDGDVHLQISEVEKQDDGDEDAAKNSYFLILQGPLDRIGRMRENLLSFLSDNKFSPLYVLKDEVSEEVSKELYPHLYKVENALRRYLIKFMATRIGANWWEITVSGEVSTKAKMRKKNDRVFGAYVNNDAYLIDFGELGEIVFAQTSGFVTREDIVEKVSRLKETPEAVKELKAEIQTNYQRFFKESFADKEFRGKWKEFEKLRNKISHCNLFTLDDLENGRVLATELLEIINNADQNTQSISITTQERESIQERVLDRSTRDDEITEEIFLEELHNEESHFKNKPNGFVGLSRFMNIHLGSLGYDHYSIKNMCEILDEKGGIEIYHVDNPDSEFKTAAIRSK